MIVHLNEYTKRYTLYTIEIHGEKLNSQESRNTN